MYKIVKVRLSRSMLSRGWETCTVPGESVPFFVKEMPGYIEMHVMSDEGEAMRKINIYAAQADGEILFDHDAWYIGSLDMGDAGVYHFFWDQPS